MAEIAEHGFANGVRLATETHGSAGSAAFSVRLPMGSARDPAGKEGVCAVLEEQLLRGSVELDSRAQADAFDGLGASRGTVTGTFHTTVSVTSLGERLPEALGLVMGMVRRPRLDEDGFEASRGLCLQSVRSLPDDPQERLQHALKARHAPSPINRPDIGTESGLGACDAGDSRAQVSRCALPGGTLMAAAGAVDHGALVGALEGLMEGWEGAGPEVEWDGKGDGRGVGERGYGHIEQATNQTHIGVVHDGPREGDEDAVLERVLTGVLDGGMSGRLFTEVRERRGLCYSVHARYGGGKWFGRTVAMAGTTPERAQETLDVLLAELRKPMEEPGGVTEEEVERAKKGIRSRLVMSGESTRARAAALGSDLFRVGRARSLEEVSRGVEGVTAEGLRAYLGRRSLGRMTVMTVGPEALRVEAGVLAGA